jgi:hypothetical protein
MLTIPFDPRQAERRSWASDCGRHHADPATAAALDQQTHAVW